MNGTQRISNLPQSVLSQVLDAYRSRPETLTEGEILFASKIRSCALCFHKWVQRSRKSPLRCPHCHKRAWNRPFVNALTMAEAGRQVQRDEQL